ncbi:MAG TPA: DUF3300 domain-containing protein [Candidatus Acidoferrum sp.]|nr:DUF3300 domain-containing protein [Candidatus Acidoferrum sp.]
MRRTVASIFVLSLTGILLIAATAPPSAARPYPQDEQQNPPPPPQYQAPPPDQNSSYQPFSADQLDNLLSPIALYPDPLLAQTLVAATFPDQVEEAARYVRANGQAGIDEQSWDISVKAIAHYPSVVQMMADKIDWTTSVGQAYVNQSADVSAAVQRLRHMARHVGNLETSPQQEVIENGDYIAIDPVQPQFIYVPVYDPAICFYRRPYWGPAITFGVGFPIGAWLNLDFHWGFGGGWGGVFYTGWHPWGGWNGGWMARCRPYVHVTNAYINNRYTTINVNRTVINRSVNVTNINRYNSIHKNVTYNNVVRQNNFQTANRNLNNRMQNNNAPPVNNKVLNRNINTANSNVNNFRGREGLQGRPDLQTQNRPPAQAQNRPQTEATNRGQQQNRPQTNAGPHTFGRSEGNFNAQASSQRGQSSRQQMSRPAPAPRGGGGGGRAGGGGGRPAGGGGKRP